MKMTKQTDTSASLIFWGPPFSGKSVLASQFPDPHFVSLDQHTLTSVRGLRAKYGLNFDVTLYDINDYPSTDQDLATLIGKRKLNAPAWEKTLLSMDALAASLGPDSTLILDNISRATEFLLSWIKSATKRELLQIQDWGTFVNQIEKLTEIINHPARKCNVIIVGHEEPHTDELTKETKRYLLMPTKARHRIPSVTTDYLYLTTILQVVKGKRVPVRMLRSMPTHDAQTGSRSLIPNIDWPTYAKIRPYLEAALGRKLPSPNWTPKIDE